MEYILIRARRKSVLFKINEKAELVIRAPRWVSVRSLEKSIESKRAWIESTRDIVLRNIMNNPPKEHSEGEAYLYLGNKLVLKYSDEYLLKPQIVAKELLVSRLHIPKIKTYLIKWYKAEAFGYFQERIDHFSQLMGTKYSALKLSSAGSRWGSCSYNGNINLNWKLIMATPEIIDYVIVHELAHLKEHNHSRDFWDVVKTVLPEYKLRRAWLKKNGHQLDF